MTGRRTPYDGKRAAAVFAVLSVRANDYAVVYVTYTPCASEQTRARTIINTVRRVQMFFSLPVHTHTRIRPRQKNNKKYSIPRRAATQPAVDRFSDSLASKHGRARTSPFVCPCLCLCETIVREKKKLKERKDERKERARQARRLGSYFSSFPRVRRAAPKSGSYSHRRRNNNNKCRPLVVYTHTHTQTSA